MLMGWGPEPDPDGLFGPGNGVGMNQFLDAVFPQDPGTHLPWDGRGGDRELAQLLGLQAPGLP